MPFSIFFAIMNFITGRHYQLKIDGMPTQHSFATQSSVPQGSHCGPLLFNLFTADIIITTDGTNNSILIYADDTKIYAIVNNIEQQLHLQTSIDRLYLWTMNNSINLNVDKTYAMSYTNKRQSSKFNSQYYILNNKIGKKTEVNDLGITFDQNFTFKNHVDSLILKSKRINAMAYKFTKEINSPKHHLTLIYVYLLPILEYSSIIWQPISKVMEA